jgi:hypothetical protein
LSLGLGYQIHLEAMLNNKTLQDRPSSIGIWLSIYQLPRQQEVLKRKINLKPKNGEGEEMKRL